MTPTSSTMMHRGGRKAEASPLFIRGRKAEAEGARAFFRACLTVFWTAPTLCSAMRLSAHLFFLCQLVFFILRFSFKTVSMRLPV